MRILIGIRGYYPAAKHGGPPVSVKNLCDLTGGEVKYYIITTDHDKDETETYKGLTSGWNRVGNAQVWYLPKAEENYAAFTKIAKDACPDVIYIQSLFDFAYTFNLLRVAKKYNIPCILATRGELSPGVFHKKYKKIPYIHALKALGLLKNVSFHVTYDDEGEKVRGILCQDEKRIHVIQNVPVAVKHRDRLSKKKPGALRAVFISRIVRNKNLSGALQALACIKGDITFDIYGFREDPAYWGECEKLIGNMPENVKAVYKGPLNHEEVLDKLTEYDVLLFPTFSENYGQIIAEALLNGCPVIISDKTPWTDINEHHAGWAISLSDKVAFAEAIECVIGMTATEYGFLLAAMKEYMGGKINLESLGGEYLQMFRQTASQK